jgi:hypothetical protein
VAVITLTIISVDNVAPDGNNTVTINTSTPWTVLGNVHTADGIGLAALGYQIDSGSVNGLDITGINSHLISQNFSFQLTADDISANGQYLLTMYGFDDDQNGTGSNTTTVTIVAVNLAPIAPKGCC